MTVVGRSDESGRGAVPRLAAMRKTTLLIDARKLEQARRVLGTTGIRDTVDRALDEVLALHARRRALEQFKAMAWDLGDAKVMRGAWK